MLKLSVSNVFCYGDHWLLYLRLSCLSQGAMAQGGSHRPDSAERPGRVEQVGEEPQGHRGKGLSVFPHPWTGFSGLQNMACCEETTSNSA